jgi:hypothetical protein
MDGLPIEIDAAGSLQSIADYRIDVRSDIGDIRLLEELRMIAGHRDNFDAVRTYFAPTESQITTRA